MGIRDTDRTLPSNRMVFELRRDPAAYAEFKRDLEASMARYGLTDEEKRAWREVDLSALARLGVHPYFLPQVSRLFKGGGYNHNDSEAARLYAEKMHIAAGAR
jgi:Aromatic-ring-opening dioxygenase LigAB, LigA subunit